MKKIKNDKKWLWIILISGLLWVCTSANRAVLAPLMGYFQDRWLLSGAEIGILGSVIYFSYFIFQIPAGIIADNWDRRKMMILSGFLQGIAILGCGYFKHIYGLIFFRILAGIFSAAIFSSGFGYLASILPSKRKVLGIAIVQSFMPLGIVIGTILTSQIVFRYNLNWGTPFIIFGFVMILSSFVFYLLTPGRKDCSPGEKEKNRESFIRKKGWLDINELFKNKNLFNLSLIAFIQCYSLFVMINWLPYFFRQNGFNTLEAGNLSSFAYILAIPATIIIAMVMSKLSTVTQLKKPLMAIMSVNILSTLIILNSTNTTILILALTIYGLTSRLSTAPLHIHLVTSFSKIKNYSKNLSIFNSFACLSMFIAPVVTGFLFDLTGMLDIGFYIAIFMEIIALLLMNFRINVAKESKVQYNYSI